MNLWFLLRLLGSLIAAGIVLIVGYGSLWLLWEGSHSSVGHWMLNLIGLVVCMILIGVVVRFIWGGR